MKPYPVSGRQILTCLLQGVLGLALLALSPQKLVAQIPESGLQVWLRASDLAHLADGTLVGLWPDSSGQGHDAVNPGQYQPVLVHNAINGMPALRFSGTSGFSSIGPFMDIPVATGSAVTAFVVAANQRNPLVREAVDIVLASKRSGDAASGATGFGFFTFNAYADPSLTFRTLGAEGSGNGSSVLLRKNGSASTSLNAGEFSMLTYLGSGIVNGPGAGQSIRIAGFAGQTTGLYGKNDIAEVLVYNRRLSPEEVYAVEAELAERYALPNAAEFIPTPGVKPYRGAELRTRSTFTYGRFDVRMRTIDASGLLASFFTYAEVDRSQWNEIDIEVMGRYDNEVQFNTITPGQTNHVHREVVSFNPHADFHDYAFEWTPEYVAWFIDGAEVHRQTGGHIGTLTRPQKLMMNVWQPTSVDWAGPFNAADLPQCSFYDRVSFASHTPGSGSAGTGNNFTPRWTDEFEALDRTRWERATHTFENNNVIFEPQNVVIHEGNLVLCVTRPDSLGYTPTAVEQPENAWGRVVARSHPNPFRPQATITYEIPAPGEVHLAVYDALGRRVAVLQDGPLPAGSHSATLNAGSLPNGVYLYRLRAGEALLTGKMLLVR